MSMTCAIVDDEPLAVKLLESYVNKTPSLTLAASYSSAVEAMDGLRSDPVDLLFLDIQMPELDGLEFARMVGDDTCIVFTTAFSQYAVDGYKVNAVDYLLKPISYPDFLASVNKAQDLLAKIRPSVVEQESKDSFFIKSDYKLIRIAFDDILYIEGLKDYVKIYLSSAPRPILSLTSMKTVENFLPQNDFLRIHRSYIVNMNKVTSLERGQVQIGERKLTVGDSYKDKILEYVGRLLLNNAKEKDTGVS